jgi:hypothetical protein
VLPYCKQHLISAAGQPSPGQPYSVQRGAIARIDRQYLADSLICLAAPAAAFARYYARPFGACAVAITWRLAGPSQSASACEVA